MGALVALLQAGAPLGVRDKNGQGLLHHAARGGHVGVAVHVMEQGADPNDPTDRWHRTALHWAVINRHPDVVRCLVHGGADVNFAVPERNHVRTTALLREPMLNAAARGGGTPDGCAILAVLLEAGADVAKADQDGLTSLHALVEGAAGRCRQEAAAAMLLAAGADPAALTAAGETAMAMAARMELGSRLTSTLAPP